MPRIHAARLRGHSHAAGRPLVFLHGLTFDHRMWDPVIDALPPGRRALALDLPGHGHSPKLADHDPDTVSAAVHEAVLAAEIDTPLVVGHSAGALVATVYASEYPCAGVVNVDAPLDSGPFARLLRSLEPRLRGEQFQDAWSLFRASMHADLLPAAMQALLTAGDEASQQLVLSYWRPLLENTPEAAAAWTDGLLACLRADQVPYLALFAGTRDPAEGAFVASRLPHAEVVSWPVEHHFPHLADPVRFAAVVTDFAARRRAAVAR
jgi:pimeloyl-ACP methyl ester carboxylesterase